MKQLHGVYAITDEKLIPEEHFVERVEQALLGGARVIQYRDKSDNRHKRMAQASALKQLCEQHHALLIINDDIALALDCDADGVHIGIQDTALIEARRTLGEDKIIGVSCYNRFELAEQAVTEGANYIAFGSFFSSSIKPDAARATPDLLLKARQSFKLPICAIGGITSANAQTLLDAGADMIAVISDIFGQEDSLQACQQLSALFSSAAR